ncbi:universal stress protein [Actinoplanes sp. NPDC048967]|uniref:universal stress protein n=1 Tax=Actinoplanes sp. NPDC048967 TaxID=3155269 RepID=UPI0034047907
MRHLNLIVGVDGSEQSRAALRWAAAEARRQDAPLRIVTAFDAPEVSARQAGEITAAAVAEARAMAPGVEVSGAAVVGDPASVLLRAGRTAAMLVVGNRGHGGFASLLLGSVSRRVVTRATGPVVVVRGRRETPSGPVTVGVDGSAAANRALALAFDQAQRRDGELLVVRSYPMPMPPYGMAVPPLPYDPDAVRRDVVRDLEATLTPWRDRYPAVRVRTLVEPGSPVKNLIDVSREAGLLVVGSRGLGALVGSLLGSVGRQLLHHADCPVMIVHPEPRTALRPRRGSGREGRLIAGRRQEVRP